MVIYLTLRFNVFHIVNNVRRACALRTKKKKRSRIYEQEFSLCIQTMRAPRKKERGGIFNVMQICVSLFPGDERFIFFALEKKNTIFVNDKTFFFCF